MNISVINASLMSGPPENGFTAVMCSTFKGGYWPLMPSPTFNEDILRMVEQYHPDCIFIQIQAPGVISEETARIIAKESVVFNWSGDVREHLDEWYYKIGNQIDCTLFSNMRDVHRLRGQGIESDWLETGVDPLIYRKHENPLPAPHIVAHFNDYGSGFFPESSYRLDIVKALQKAFGDKFGVFGNIKQAKGNFNNSQLDEGRNYAGAKIAINCSHFKIQKYASDRLGRILLSGAMCLSHDFPGIEEMYQPGKELVTFANIEDLIFKCKYFLEHDSEREQIAAAGQQKALQTHTFDFMAKEILRYYLKYKNKA